MLQKLLRRWLGITVTSYDLEVRFHTEANFFGEHGTIVVSHIGKKIVETPVRFVFVGVTTPPVLSLALMGYIWEQARNQGYIPHSIRTYGRDNDIVDASRALQSIRMHQQHNNADKPRLPAAHP